MNRRSAGLLLTLVAVTLATTPLAGQEARARWERMCQIRAEKFDLVLPQAMDDNDIDMWIVVMREGLLDPMWEALGRGYVGDWAYYVFTRRDGRVERAALGVGGYRLEQCHVYDYVGGAGELADFVAERNPQQIGVNMAASIGGAGSARIPRQPARIGRTSRVRLPVHSHGGRDRRVRGGG